ncbi:unnamed protein product [Zymoseptoria tritici ST99CH_1E4]|uniref:Uncharacterized protein n=1 Tax=Zymoseptoria tritici ST99CH_1E4 TaxID=1276532 RepID=A0A2H1GFR4_ZYMTR|nr:unnamed protein product [Zymoseptoria tritici ST99CH_1E4]
MRFFATLCFLSTLLIPFATAQMGPECQYKNICDCCTPQGYSDSTGYCHTKDNGNTHYCLPPAAKIVSGPSVTLYDPTKPWPCKGLCVSE